MTEKRRPPIALRIARRMAAKPGGLEVLGTMREIDDVLGVLVP